MVHVNSFVRVIDNSGVFVIKCIKIYGKAPNSVGVVGDTVLCVIKHCKSNISIKYGDFSKGVIVRSKLRVKRSSSIQIFSDFEAIVLINDRGLPVGTRIRGFVFLELAKKAVFARLLIIAAGVI